MHERQGSAFPVSERPDYPRRQIQAAASSEKLGLIQATLTIQAAPAPVAGEAPKNPKFTLAAYNGGPMTVGGWRAPVVVDLQGLRVAAQRLPVYCNHEQTVECLLGQTAQISIAGGQLSSDGEITGRTPTCQAVMQHAANGFQWQASIGASVDQNEFLAEGKTAIVNGRSVSGPVNIARKSTLGEISFVALGADTSTSAKIAASQKSAAQETNMQFAEWLEAEYGMKAADLDADQTAKFQAKFEASKKPPADPPAATPPVTAGAAPPAEPDPVAENRKRMQAEYERIGKVQTIAAKYPEVLAKAIGEGWDEARTTTEVKLADVQAGRAPGHIGTRGTGGYALTAKAIEACALMGFGVSDERLAKDREYGEQAVEAGRKLPRGIGPAGIMELCARMEGIDLPVGGHRSNDWIRAAFSTTSLTNILSNLQNKMLLEGYNSVEQAWRMVARKGPLNDFKVHTRVRLTSDMIFEKLGPDGEIKHGKLDEQAYTIQGDTYGKMLGLTRKMIVNDDLGALQDQPMQLGIGAADAINDAFWTAFMANYVAGATFFPVNNSKLNYISGAGTVLCFDSLAQLYSQFLKQTKPNGRPLGVEPAILLVPAELRVRADQLMQSTQLIPQLVTALTANSGTPADNTMRNKFQVVSSAYLSNSAYTNYSATAWFLLCNPTRLHLLEVGFLNGQEMPVVERAETDFDTLGIQFRAFFDFGVGTGEYRAAAMSKGAA